MKNISNYVLKFLFLLCCFSSVFGEGKYDWLEKKLLNEAENGNVQSQYLLGSLYSSPEFQKFNINQAAYWSEKAAKNGNMNAACDLWAFNLMSDWKGHSAEKALYWIKKADENNAPCGAYGLALMNERGLFVKQDLKKAITLYTKAAQAGDTRSQNNLAVMYLNGSGVPASKEQYLFWTQKAANQGDPIAMFKYGNYLLGENGKENQRKAMAYFRQSLSHGCVPAAGSLAFMYLNGGLLERNTILAYALFDYASQAENKIQTGVIEEQVRDLSKKTKATIESKMSEAEVNQGKALSRELSVTPDLLKTIENYTRYTDKK